MEYFSNPDKKVEIELNRRTYKRHVIKVDEPVKLNSNLSNLIKKYIVPIYKEGDILCISNKLAAICTSSFLYQYDIKASTLAQKAALKVQLMPGRDFQTNLYAMQVAIYLVGTTNILKALITSNGSREAFIQSAGKKLKFISGLDDTYFPEYKNIAILPTVTASDICHTLIRDFSISCFIASATDKEVNILATSRDIKMSPDILAQMVSDNPLGEGALCTPFCIIRNEDFVPPPKHKVN